ncbi:MAG: DUF2139 domain-containing protein [Sulfolobales archaeon]
MVLEKIPTTFPSRLGPEWGSGGVFGLKYHKGVLYFTLAFEAESHFITRNMDQIYKFELVGPQPVSGGDTYNAVDAVDDKIFFGGWVHAPAVFKGREEVGSKILFLNKYSHVHEYNISEGRVSLLWKEGLGDLEKWVGEISEIIFDPVSTKLLLARADGHENLGVYRLDPNSRKIERISNRPALKGSYFMDYACFDISIFEGIEGFQCLDLYRDSWILHRIDDLKKKSIDGGDLPNYSMGSATEAYGRFFAFVRGGLFVGNPIEPELEDIMFIRLFDYSKNSLSPRRSNSQVVGGGVLVAYNSYVEAAYHLETPELLKLSKTLNYINSPSVLLYITPPQARIVGVYGARITSMEKLGGKILLGYSTTANLGGRDASIIDSGVRGITIIDEDVVNRPSPPYYAKISLENIGGRIFGGVPLYGYKNKDLSFYLLNKDVELYIYEYDLGLPPQLLGIEKFIVKAPKDNIDLGGFKQIVSFKINNAGSGLIYIELMN